MCSCRPALFILEASVGGNIHVSVFLLFIYWALLKFCLEAKVILLVGVQKTFIPSSNHTLKFQFHVKKCGNTFKRSSLLERAYILVDKKQYRLSYFQLWRYVILLLMYDFLWAQGHQRAYSIFGSVHTSLSVYETSKRFCGLENLRIRDCQNNPCQCGGMKQSFTSG